MKKVLFALAAVVTLFGCTKGLEERVDALEDRVTALEEKVNSEVQNLANLIDGLKNNVYVTGVTEIMEGDKVIGYTIAMSKGPAITIYHGEDGKDGNPGKDGADGEDGKDGTDGANGADGSDGADGADGATPQIGVVLENGIYYWTVNGEKLTDENGNYIQASDLTCPKFKKEGGTWYISTDGSSWAPLISTNTGSGNSCVFTDVTYNDSSVTFVIGETEITVPRQEQFKLTIEQVKDIVVLPSAEVTVAYSIKGATENTAVYAVADAGWGVKVQPESISAGKIVINTPETVEGKVLVFAGDDSHAAMVALSFEEGKVTTSENAFSVGKDGSAIEVPVSTNLEYEVVIPEDVTWITYAETKAMRDETIVLNVAANDGYPREASLELVYSGRTLQTITVSQEAGAEAPYTLADITGEWENASGNWMIEEYAGNGTNVKISTIYGYGNSDIKANFDFYTGDLTIATPQQGFNYSGYYSLAVRSNYVAQTAGYDAVFTLSPDKKTLKWDTTCELVVIYDMAWPNYPTLTYSGNQLVLTRPASGDGDEEGGETTESVAVVGTWTVSYTNNAGTALSFDMPIEASDNVDKGNVILKRWMDYSARETACTIYATYDDDAKTLSIASGQALSMSSPYYGDTLAAKDASNANVDPIVFTVNEDVTEMTIDENIKFGQVYISSFSSYGSGYKMVKK